MPLPTLRARAALLLFALATGVAPAAPTDSVFGSDRPSSGASLVGILYDLKLNQARERMPMGNETYGKIVDEFISTDWDESVLNRYFRAPLPLYTTQIFIPLIDANSAPKAFRVAEIVKPQHWLVHYKGQVSAPESGEWRFWGYGEEICAVAINGKNILVANWREVLTPRAGWKSSEPPGLPAAGGRLVAGDWITLT